MQTLAIKYRPKTFDDVVEQTSVRDILMEQIKTKTHKNAYLFTGGAGTGKTTCARIFHSEINQGQGSCIEIDAASNNGVDDVREIRANAGFKAIDCEFKIYIIDECHMLSNGAWNAMLKLLEEPPTKTIFIFCTTDPQKIPATILSRVQRYDFQRISFEAVWKRLDWILHQECLTENKYAWDASSLKYIAKLADGGMRDAITLLDKVTSYTNSITLESVVEALGTIDYQDMFDLVGAVCQRDDKHAITIIEDIHARGIELKQFIKQFLSFVLDMCKYNLFSSFDYIQIPAIFEEHLQCFSYQNYDLIKSTLLDAILKLNNNIKWDTAPKPLIEATFMLLCNLGVEE